MTRTGREGRYDLAVVGAGIVGLAAALAAARRGYRVVVIDRDAQANGASVRNFGFVTVSGQERGSMWKRARFSRDVWCEVTEAAGIPIRHTGLWMIARRPEAVRVLEAFMASDMADGCRLLTSAQALGRCASLKLPPAAVVLESSVELRVDSREAIPRLAAWLATAYGVEFMREASVTAIDMPSIHTSRGTIEADRVAVCPGDDYTGLYAERIAAYSLTRCKLQMLRLANPGFKLPGALMSDLGLARYPGYAALAEAAPLKARLAVDQAEHVAHGVHLIVVQDADGSLIVGDSHHYAATPDPFSQDSVDALILDEFEAALGIAAPATLERWLGTYAAAVDRPFLIDAPEAAVRLAIVTCGAGASTGFAIGEEMIASFEATGSTP